MSDYSTALHEASHCSAGWLLNREVDHTWVATGSVQVGETAGFALLPIKGRVEPSQVVVCLVGYWSTNTPGWPPSFEDALSEEREGLGQVLRCLEATKTQYDATVQYTRELLSDPDFIVLRDSIARALARVPRIERETIERLAEIHFNPEPEGALA